MLLGCGKCCAHLRARGARRDQIASDRLRLFDPLADNADDHLRADGRELGAAGFRGLVHGWAKPGSRR